MIIYSKAALPESASDVKKILSDQINQLKVDITKLRPMGARIDGCRAALLRATARRDKAQNAFAEAQQTLIEAEMHVAMKEKELHALTEESMKSQPAQANSTCLQDLQSGMQRVVQEMQAAGTIPQEYITKATAEMESLFSGLSQFTVQNQPQQTPPQSARQNAGPANACASPGMGSYINKQG